ncbi:hypothetical protein J6590_099728, partial [Homalodisca vitripennis]
PEIFDDFIVHLEKLNEEPREKNAVLLTFSPTSRRSKGRSGADGERVFLSTFTIKCFAIGSSYFSLTNGALARLNFSVGRQRDNCDKYVSSTHFSEQSQHRILIYRYMWQRDNCDKYVSNTHYSEQSRHRILIYQYMWQRDNCDKYVSSTHFSEQSQHRILIYQYMWQRDNCDKYVSNTHYSEQSRHRLLIHQCMWQRDN